MLFQLQKISQQISLLLMRIRLLLKNIKNLLLSKVKLKDNQSLKKRLVYSLALTLLTQSMVEKCQYGFLTMYLQLMVQVQLWQFQLMMKETLLLLQSLIYQLKELLPLKMVKKLNFHIANMAFQLTQVNLMDQKQLKLRKRQLKNQLLKTQVQ